MQISNADKILFAAADVSKKALVTYYRLIAPYMLPHIEGRPLSLMRFPDGADGEHFYQKEASASIPTALRRIEVSIDNSPRTYLTADSADAIATFGTLVAEPHIWVSTAPDFRRGDLVVWDLDPAESMTFEHVRVAARLVRRFLSSLGADPHVKVTGSRGLHISIRLATSHPVESIFEFSRDVATHLAGVLPDVFTTEFTRARRGERIYLDFLRNRYAQTFIAPYGVRALPTAPIAAPIRWTDLDGAVSNAGIVTVRNVAPWLQENRSWLQGWGRETTDFVSITKALGERLRD